MAKLHDELRLSMISYYEGILKMEGASGVIQKLAYNRPIKPLNDAGLDIPRPPPTNIDAPDNAPDNAPAAPAAAPAAPAADAHPPLEAAASPMKPAPARGAGARKNGRQ